MNKILINKYDIIREIGQGGEGNVYLAYDKHLKLEMAVKKLPHKSAINTGNLWHEVNMLKQMEHPALPTVYDFFHENECDYMVMEYIHGITLADYIRKKGNFKQNQAIIFIRQLLSVIGYFHSFNPPIIYRDLKPENIILRGDGQIKLIDFGTAFILYGFNESLVRAGTPGFTAPELFKAGCEYHENSDIYSLGAILFFILTGKVPNEIKRKRYLYQKSYLKWKSCLKQFKVSRGIRKIISRCLHKNPEKRYQNVNQLEADMKNYCYFEISHLLKRLIKRVLRICLPLMLLLIGILILQYESTSLGVPILIMYENMCWNSSLPLTIGFSAGTLLILAGFYFTIANIGEKNRDVRITKNIYLSDKKTTGLGLVIVICMIMLMMKQDDVYAVSKAPVFKELYAFNRLPTFIRDQNGYKLLIKNDTVYYPKHDIIIELPLDKLPKGIEMILKVVLEGEDWQYESREYLIIVDAT